MLIALQLHGPPASRPISVAKGVASRLIAAAGMVLASAFCAAAQPVLVLEDAAASIDAWPAVTVLSDPSHRWGVREVLTRLHEFEKPVSPHANLGVRTDAIWLRIPVTVPNGQTGNWLLNIDYPLLNRVDAHVIWKGETVQHALMGNTQPNAGHAFPARAPTMELNLKPGQSYELLIGVSTHGSTVLPITIIKAEAFHVREVRIQMLLGLAAGIALCLIISSLAQWVSLRDTMFLSYALAMFGSAAFFFAYFGLGPQHLWSENAWLTRNAAVLAAHIGSIGGALFVDRVLAVSDWNRYASLGLKTIAVASTVMCVGLVAGTFDYRSAQLLATVLAPTLMALAVPAAYVRMRGGDRAAAYVMVGWGVFVVGNLIFISLLRGLLPVRFWSAYAYQFSALIQMVMWMRVMGVRIEAIRSFAKRVNVERDMLRSMAFTDPLTALPNRRGLNEALRNVLPNASADYVVAVYMLDLDGFKAINDTLGHDAGDDLLIQVARRLQKLLRTSDVVARLGGDEFVIVAGALHSDEEAQLLGHKVLDVFKVPFVVSGESRQVGLTVGYSLAPLDGRDADKLLKRADSGMYTGKQAGKNCMRRGFA